MNIIDRTIQALDSPAPNDGAVIIAQSGTSRIWKRETQDGPLFLLTDGNIVTLRSMDEDLIRDVFAQIGRERR